jgi:hypothetical protein
MRVRVALRAGPAVLLMVAGLAVSACGAKQSGTGVASLPNGSASAHASASPAGDALKYAQCMRAHGIAKFPDPGADGTITINPGDGVDPNSDQVKTAAEACKAYAPTGGGAPGAKKADPHEQEKDLAFAKCMRDHGIAGYPDPTTRDDGSLSWGLPKGTDINSDQFKAAQQACKSLLPDGGQPAGAGS